MQFSARHTAVLVNLHIVCYVLQHQATTRHKQVSNQHKIQQPRRRSAPCRPRSLRTKPIRHINVYVQSNHSPCTYSLVSVDSCKLLNLHTQCQKCAYATRICNDHHTLVWSKRRSACLRNSLLAFQCGCRLCQGSHKQCYVCLRIARRRPCASNEAGFQFPQPLLSDRNCHCCQQQARRRHHAPSS